MLLESIIDIKFRLIQLPVTAHNTRGVNKICDPGSIPLVHSVVRLQLILHFESALLLWQRGIRLFIGSVVGVLHPSNLARVDAQEITHLKSGLHFHLGGSVIVLLGYL
jgi:hypothetical protein